MISRDPSCGVQWSKTRGSKTSEIAGKYTSNSSFQISYPTICKEASICTCCLILHLSNHEKLAKGKAQQPPGNTSGRTESVVVASAPCQEDCSRMGNITSPRQLSFGEAFRSRGRCRPHSVLVCCHVDAREGEFLHAGRKEVYSDRVL